MRFQLLNDEQILAELAERLDFLRRVKGYSDRNLAERGGVSVRTIVAFRNNKDITLTSFLKLLRGIGEIERLEQLLPPAEPTFSPQKQGFVEPPKRIRRKSRSKRDSTFEWGDGS